jgi:hypothetical protein
MNVILGVIYELKLILFLCYIVSVAGPQEEHLIEDIFSKRNYSRLSRPVAEESDALEIKFGLSLQQIINVVIYII